MMEHSQTLSPTQIESEARQALDRFLTPPINAPTESEQAVLANANLFSVPFGSIELRACAWGTGDPVLLAHGWGGYGLQLSGFVEPLVSAGYQVIAFDAPAHGDTEGLQTNGMEMARAISAVARNHGPLTGIIAHSLGAASTTLALSEGMQADKVVYIGAMCWLSNAAKVFSRRAKLSPDVEAAFRELFELEYGRDIWQKFAVDSSQHNPASSALLFHDLRDREVSFEESRAIASAWSGARSIETSGLGHRRILRDESVIQQAVDFIAR
jgi:alpha-beta hydrolase superfamily lysophospholipase